MHNYQDPKTCQKYLDFLDSPNGQIQQKVLLKAIRTTLPNSRSLIILDAACGPGWLASSLKKEFASVEACDSSEFFINFAKNNYPKIDFKIAVLDKILPYPKNYFDVLILNMAAPDLTNLREAFANLSVLIKTDGKLIVTIPNPDYTYPAAEWKTSLGNLLLGRKPKLKMKTPPREGTKITREFTDSKIDSYYYTLDSYLKATEKAGLKLTIKEEILSQTDSSNFDLNYQLYRYPLLLLLKFKKILQ